MNWLSWLLRGLMAAGGVVLIWQDLPVARSAWQAQRTDSVMKSLRAGLSMSAPDVAAGLASLDRAIELDPSGRRYLIRSELAAGSAETASVNLSTEERIEYLRLARTDLETGLAKAPARGIDWLRLTVVRQLLDGESRNVVATLFMSIETAPMMSYTWPIRLRIILDNWAYLTDEQRERLRAHIVLSWRRTDNRRWFGQMVYSPADELILRFFLRNEPKAQEELTKLILESRK